MQWIKASERLPLHKAHWVTKKYGTHDNDFPVRMRGRYGMANLFDEAKPGDPPEYNIEIDGHNHFSDEFEEIEWLDESPSPSLPETEQELLMTLEFENCGDKLKFVCPDEDDEFAVIVQNKGARHAMVYAFDLQQAREISSWLSRHCKNSEDAAAPPPDQPVPEEVSGHPDTEKEWEKLDKDSLIWHLVINKLSKETIEKELSTLQSRLSSTEAERDAIRKAFDEQAEELRKSIKLRYMADNKTLLVIPPGSVSEEDKVELRKGGFILIETDSPQSIKVIHNTGGDDGGKLLQCALDAMAFGADDTIRLKFSDRVRAAFKKEAK